MARHLPIIFVSAFSIYISTIVIRFGIMGATDLPYVEATIIFLGLAFIALWFLKIRDQSRRLPWEDERE